MRNFINLIIFHYRCVREFGFWKGTGLFFSVNNGKKGEITIPGYPHKVYFRPGSKSGIRADWYTFQEIFLLKSYNYSFNHDIRYIVDAGANIGFAALYFVQRYPNARIICLEPDDDNFKILQKNTEKYDQITVLKNALWYKDSKIKIINPEAEQRGYMVGEADAQSESYLEGISPDSLMEKFNIPNIDIFKIDIEGAEKEVFENNFETWLPKSKSLFIELHDRMKEGTSKSVFNAISKYNYKFDMLEENLIFTQY